MDNGENFAALHRQILACTLCKDLPLGPNPIVQLDPHARILIAGQAPGRITHAKNIPFDDPSGERLRSWLGVSAAQFYDPKLIAILPMGFCFPGAGKSGDLPPRPECAPAWRDKALSHLQNLSLTLVIGQYAIDWHVPERPKRSLTQRVKTQAMSSSTLILPHPSPRNNRWLKKNEWFDQDTLPALKQRVTDALA